MMHKFLAELNLSYSEYFSKLQTNSSSIIDADSTIDSDSATDVDSTIDAI